MIVMIKRISTVNKVQPSTYAVALLGLLVLCHGAFRYNKICLADVRDVVYVVLVLIRTGKS